MNPDPAIARECVEASLRSYACSNIQTYLAHALVLESGERTILAFRGTHNIRDWLTDAEFVRNDIGIHCGFFEAWCSVRGAILDFAAKRDAAKPLYVTGHSLGGALAVLCAAAFTAKSFPFEALYTFGQPRVGDKTFASASNKTFGGRHFRYINAEDIVPRVPGWLMGYRHSGNAVFMDSWGGMAFQPTIGLMALSDAFGLFSEWTRGRRLALLADHPIDRYLARL